MIFGRKQSFFTLVFVKIHSIKESYIWFALVKQTDCVTLQKIVKTAEYCGLLRVTKQLQSQN